VAEGDIRFQALEYFHSPELGSCYVKNLSYTARPGDTKLRALLPQWESEGKIRSGGPAAQMQGKG
jgi:hypothetical protein